MALNDNPSGLELTFSWQTFVPQTSITFVSKASVDTGTVQTYGLRKRIEVVKNCRNICKKDMKYNGSMPKMKVDPETYVSNLVTLRVKALMPKAAHLGRGSRWGDM